MKLREKFKRFWTMDVHNHEGFTLVELIIVIAILAILSGVAVAGYSAYIKKANMQADQTLIAEIKNVLMMNYYSSEVPQAAFVVITLEGENYASDEGEKAMAAAFGSNWKTALSLKYNGWEDTLLDAIKLQNGLGLSSAVGNSSFMSSTPSELLGEVSDVTNTALEFIEKYNSDPAALYDTMCGLYFADDTTKFNEYCKQYGLETEKNANGEWVFKDATSAELSNFLVFATADDMSNLVDAEANQTEYSSSVATDLVMGFAMFNAYTKYANDPAVDAAYEEMLDAMANASTPAEIMDAFSIFEDAVNEDDLAAYMADQGNIDQAAFLGMMDGLDSVSSNVDLTDTNLFAADGKIAGQFSSYIAISSLGDLLTEIGTLPEGALLVVIDENGNVN